MQREKLMEQVLAFFIIVDGLFLLGAVHLWAIKQYRK